ncbi:MAG TPA: ABC transporter ATP-binding protein [Ktedonobacteraceae bacterium]|nr:ABC transporter ATP-binding protein [Ktedonobacteraceae bacterium]
MTTIGLPPARSGQLAGTIQVNVENVSKVIVNRFTQTTILDTLSFAVPRGTLFSINGPSGSGKSTLLNILTGIDRASSGQVSFGGQVLQRMSENRLAKWRGRNVGIVFQFFQLLPTLTAQENVLMALELGRVLPRRQRRARAEECLKLVGMENYMKRLPGELSGGQQQRVAIARALANNPPVLVADEPTGNLDSQTARQIFDLLAGLTLQGQTIIYVTHDRDLAQRATAGIDLLDGRIVGRRDVSS